MINPFKPYWIVACVLIWTALFSCANDNSRLIGFWKADFQDSTGKHTHFYQFTLDVNHRLELTVDEPDEDWYGVPAQNLEIDGDRIHFEKFWGNEKFDGVLSKNDSTLSGFRKISGHEPVPWTLIRAGKDDLKHRIPRLDLDGKEVMTAGLTPPQPSDDGLETGTLSVAGFNTSLIVECLNRILLREIPNIHAILLLKNGKLVLEEYFYGYSRDRLHGVQSVTKSVTSSLIGIAGDQGRISSTRDFIWKYFTDYPGSKWIVGKYPIRLEQVLDMTAGLNWKPLSLDQSCDVVDMLNSNNPIGYVLNRELRFEPGIRFEYNDGLSILLGGVIRRSTHARADSFAAQYLFKPLGIDRYAWDLLKDGTLQTGGGLRLRPRDMAKFGMMYLNQGKWNGERIVSKEWVEESTRAHVQAGNGSYGYQWWIRNYSIKHNRVPSYFALGHGEQAVIVFPTLDMVLVMTAGNYFQPERRPFEISAEYILPSVLSIPDASVSLDPDSCGDYLGKYLLPGNETLRVDTVGNTLYGTDPANRIFKLVPITQSYFYIEGDSREVAFVKRDSSNGVSLEIYNHGMQVDRFEKIN